MLTLILLIIAFICFILAAINRPILGLDMTAVGLALWVLTVLIGGR